MEIISHAISDLILSIAKLGQIFRDNMLILNLSWQQIVVDIALVAIIFYFLLTIIRGSRAVHVLTGLIIVSFGYLISKSFQLIELAWLLEKTLTVVLVAIPVIFQHELRSALEKIGNTKIITPLRVREMDNIISQVAEASEVLAKNKVGALIVFQLAVPLKEYIETGIPINANISRELLISLFGHSSPLHDGAVIIADHKIMAASCVLPHSTSVTTGLGTRHKSALGLSETTDAIVVVISEERGVITVVRKGNMKKNISADELRQYLAERLNPVKPKNNSTKKKKNE
jgi:diadenylate cyclase